MAPSDRKLLLQAQGIPQNCNALREDRRKLQRDDPPRRISNRSPMNVHTPSLSVASRSAPLNAQTLNIRLRPWPSLVKRQDRLAQKSKWGLSRTKNTMLRKAIGLGSSVKRKIGL